jgi:hypothetical protein
MPDFIASVSGHLTQNHVVSSRSPRIYGSQLSSSVAGIRSGLVNTPVKSHHLLLLKKDIPDIPTVLSPQGSYSRASRCAPWLTKSAAFPFQKKALLCRSGTYFRKPRSEGLSSSVFQCRILPVFLQAAYHVLHRLQQIDLGRMLKMCKNVLRNEPGRSIKLRSSTSGPEIWRTMRFSEKEHSVAVSAPERKTFGNVDGLKIALCALRTRSVTSDFSVMGSPNGIF